MANLIARRLRNNSTDAEQRLWSKLRLLKARGFHFRRQVPIDHFIVDFVCFSARLVIELDGGQHNLASHQRRDEQRDLYLRGQGFQVVRFWNNDVFGNLEGVTNEIVRLLNSEDPHPNPSPQGGGA